MTGSAWSRLGPGHYRLTADHEVELVPVESTEDLIRWAQEVWGEDRDRRVAFTEVAPGIEVSTVFLGLDHSFGRKGPPLVFETMIFDDYEDGDCFRYATWDEAVAGHARAVASLQRVTRGGGRKVLGLFAKGDSK